MVRLVRVLGTLLASTGLVVALVAASVDSHHAAVSPGERKVTHLADLGWGR